MRVLDYRCNTCDFLVIDEWIRTKEDELKVCPSCGSADIVVVWNQAPSQAIGFHPYNVFRNKMDDPNTIIRSVVPKTYKGGKK